MQNVFISSSIVTSGSLIKGGMGFGVTEQNYGPTTANTGFYNTIIPPAGGYVFYKTKTQNGPIVRVASNNADLIGIVQQYSGTTYSISGALQWVSTQSDSSVTNFDYPNIVTSGSVFNVDAMSTLSYPQTGSTWYDISGGNITGSVSGALSYSKTGNSGSLLFNGSTTYFNFGNQNLGLDLISKSFVAWVNLSASLANPTAIIDKQFDNTSPGDYGGWGFWVGSNRKLWWWNTSNQDIIDTGPNTIGTNVWTHIAVTYNASTKTATFYINGTQNSSISNSSILEKSSSTALLAVGASRISTTTIGYVNGAIANVLAYNRVLSTAEIVTNYSASKPLFGL